MRIGFFDCETTMRNHDIGDHKASPFHADNRIVLIGAAINTGIIKTTDNTARFADSVLPKVDLLVGHNIKFDLLHLWCEYPVCRDHCRDLRIWDTQLAEYIISGQTHLYPSLDECSEKYGGTLKDDRIKEYWKSGMDTTEIPMDELEDYLVHDVNNTRTVFYAQMELVEKMGITALVMSQMNALLATTEMEFNGMKFNKDGALEQAKELQIGRDRIELVLRTTMEMAGITDSNPASNDHISLMLFGGKQKYIGKEIVLDENGEPARYKTGMKKGEIKTRNATMYKLIEGMVNPKPEWETKKQGFYQVGDDVLKDVRTQSFNDYVDEYITNLLVYRKLQKDINTYYLGYSDLVWPHSEVIHHNLNHCATATGRLSSTKPNLQNVTSAGDSDIKDYFTSRFEHGLLMEADYSQLEMVGLAFVSGDPVLKNDIINGVDFHCMNASFLYNKEYHYIFHKVHMEEDKEWIDKRKKSKGPGFLIVYGGGAKTMSKNTGIPIDDCKNFIRNYYERYSGVKDWQDSVAEEVRLSRKPSAYRTEMGLPAGVGEYISLTGRRYRFKEYDAPDFVDEDTSFSPTQMKNYPVQGISTGDIVPMIVGELYRAIRSKPEYDGKVLLINTIHDSVLFDIDAKSIDVEKIRALVIRVMEDAPRIFEEYFGVRFDLPLKVTASFGSTWAKTK